MTLLVAITGGIGSGKSTFSNQVIKRKLKLQDSDGEVAKLYQKPNKNFINHLVKIGLSSSIQNKKINKKVIAETIFSNKEIKTNLEKYIFQIIRKKRLQFIKKETKQKIIFFDIPLLIENNLQKEFDFVVSVISTRKNRFLRLKKSKLMTKKIFNNIIKHQTSDRLRKKHSNIVIYNNQSLKKYIININNILDILVK